VKTKTKSNPDPAIGKKTSLLILLEAAVVGIPKIQNPVHAHLCYRHMALPPVLQRWWRSRSAGVGSGRSLRFLAKPEKDLESDFWMKTGPGTGVRISFFTGVGWLILLKLNILWTS